MTDIVRLNSMASCWTLDHVLEQARDLFEDCEVQGSDPKDCYFEMNIYELKLLYDAYIRASGTQVGEWRDISSAPRDGTEILASWFHESLQRFVTRIVYWTDEVYPWMDGKRYNWESVSEDRPNRYLSDWFTHWQPLPAPPVSGGKDV